MLWLGVLIGALVALAGVLMLLWPARFVDFCDAGADRAWFYVSAVGGRLLLGTVLVLEAGNTRFPVVIEALGWVVLAAALVLALLGRKSFARLLRWIMGVIRPITRMAGMFAILLGAALVYALTA